MEQRPEWSVVKNWQRGRGRVGRVWGELPEGGGWQGGMKGGGRGRKQDRDGRACGVTGGGRVLTGSKKEGVLQVGRRSV